MTPPSAAGGQAKQHRRPRKPESATIAGAEAPTPKPPTFSLHRVAGASRIAQGAAAKEPRTGILRPNKLSGTPTKKPGSNALATQNSATPNRTATTLNRLRLPWFGLDSDDPTTLEKTPKRTRAKGSGSTSSNFATQDPPAKDPPALSPKRLPLTPRTLFDSESDGPSTPKGTPSSERKAKKWTSRRSGMKLMIEGLRLKNKDRPRISGGYGMMTDEEFMASPIRRKRSGPALNSM